MNAYCDALATCSALSVGKCGRFWCAVPPGTRSGWPNRPTPGVTSVVNISIASTLWPATIGAAADVPPKPLVQLLVGS